MQVSFTVWDLNESAGKYVWITSPIEDRLLTKASKGNQSFKKKVSGVDHTLILPVKQDNQIMLTIEPQFNLLLIVSLS